MIHLRTNNVIIFPLSISWTVSLFSFSKKYGLMIKNFWTRLLYTIHLPNFTKEPKIKINVWSLKKLESLSPRVSLNSFFVIKRSIYLSTYIYRYKEKNKEKNWNFQISKFQPSQMARELKNYSHLLPVCPPSNFAFIWIWFESDLNLNNKWTRPLQKQRKITEK